MLAKQAVSGLLLLAGFLLDVGQENTLERGSRHDKRSSEYNLVCNDIFWGRRVIMNYMYIFLSLFLFSFFVRSVRILLIIIIFLVARYGA
jgi:hypothetical protein